MNSWLFSFLSLLKKTASFTPAAPERNISNPKIIKLRNSIAPAILTNATNFSLYWLPDANGNYSGLQKMKTVKTEIGARQLTKA
jgi:hypothetical protein